MTASPQGPHGGGGGGCLRREGGRTAAPTLPSRLPEAQGHLPQGRQNPWADPLPLLRPGGAGS